MRESLNKYNKLLTEQSGPTYRVSAEWCNGYGDWSCNNNWPIGGTYGACDANGNPLAHYGAKTLTWSAVSDIGGQTPQVGMYVKYRNLAWYVRDVALDGTGVGASLQEHPGGNLCSSKFVCSHDGQGNPQCTQVGLSHIGSMFASTGNEFGSMEYCQENCTQGIPTVPSQCSTNISSLHSSIIKPLNQAGLTATANNNPPPTHGECSLKDFIWDTVNSSCGLPNMPQGGCFQLIGCAGVNAGDVTYKITGPNGFVVGPTTGSNALYSSAAIGYGAGKYTGTVECTQTQGIDSHDICLEGDTWQGYTEVPCSHTVTLGIDREHRGPSELTNPNIGAKQTNPEDNEIKLREERNIMTIQDLQRKYSKLIPNMNSIKDPVTEVPRDILNQIVADFEELISTGWNPLNEEEVRYDGNCINIWYAMIGTSMGVLDNATEEQIGTWLQQGCSKDGCNMKHGCTGILCFCVGGTSGLSAPAQPQAVAEEIKRIRKLFR